MFQMIYSLYSLNQSKKSFKKFFNLYSQKKKILDPSIRETIQLQLSELQSAILNKNHIEAKRLTLDLENAANRWMAKTQWDKTRDFILSIGFALTVAIVIRQTWFEPYAIPTGSMRPTFKEGDYLVVSKTDFGINTLFRSGHFYFDPTLVKRGSIVIFSGKDMDMQDDDTMYFYLIPGKKQYIKRLIGKPGDTLYFYGGEIYGIDSQGNELRDLLDPSYFKEIEHIPFIRFEGKTDTIGTAARGVFSTSLIYQMNLPIAKLKTNAIGGINGEMLQKNITHFSDLWGFKNYGMCRILTPEQVDEIYPGELKKIENGLLYLEIQHHPSIQGASLKSDEMGRIRPSLGMSTSLLPLTEAHLNSLMKTMTTCRFIVKNGKAIRYGSEYTSERYRPELPGVPDGTYEFQNGKAVEVLFSGITKELKPTHPLLKKDANHVQSLYNFGFEWFKQFTPSKHSFPPSRYCYFKDGNLYTMGGPIVLKDDPLLHSFLIREKQRQAISTSLNPYFPFEDAKAPLKPDGTFDREFIQKYGVTIPDKMYLVMGDNHAMSADSRHFGFVPQENLRGSASFLFWPAGDRWGRLPQAAIDYLTVPNLSVWIIALIAAILSYLYIHKKYYKKLKL